MMNFGRGAKRTEKAEEQSSAWRGRVSAKDLKYEGTSVEEAPTDIFKDIWTGIICSIHKKRDKADLENYRGMTILNDNKKTANNKIGEHQCGFKAARSTTDHLFCC
ncbi:hypothetical protein HHI36_015421 [Cryptolaemus montrouzieri]|uniref:Uncharacterized protein n=1 Tax=Cryptolaemus montrouzieri TaxID=559131 RepID=A0ABD2N5K5_9CUCU